MSNDGLFIILECIIYHHHRSKPGTDKYTIVIKEERKNGCAGPKSIFQKTRIKSLKCRETLEGK